MSPEDILARTIVGEARGEGEIGMQAVANVVMNRVKAQRWWGSTITIVCLKPFQFSCWNDGDPNKAIITNLDDSYSIFREAMDIASKVISGEMPDITNGATSYFAKGIPTPKWAVGHTPCAEIGRHLFFNDVA